MWAQYTSTSSIHQKAFLFLRSGAGALHILTYLILQIGAEVSLCPFLSIIAKTLLTSAALYSDLRRPLVPV